MQPITLRLTYMSGYPCVYVHINYVGAAREFVHEIRNTRCENEREGLEEPVRPAKWPGGGAVCDEG